MDSLSFFRIESSNECFVVNVVQDITDYGGKQLTEEENEVLSLLATERPDSVIVDFSGIRYFSSRGIDFLLRVHKRAAEARGRAVVCGLSVLTAEIIATSRINQIIDVYDGRSEAIFALKNYNNPD